MYSNIFSPSCDSNTIRCNVNKSSILVAVNHIPMGQEITESYSVHFRLFRAPVEADRLPLYIIDLSTLIPGM